MSCCVVQCGRGPGGEFVCLVYMPVCICCMCSVGFPGVPRAVFLWLGGGVTPGAALTFTMKMLGCQVTMCVCLGRGRLQLLVLGLCTSDICLESVR